MKPRGRGIERDFNAELAEALSKWKEAYDALYRLTYNYEWEAEDESMRKQLTDAKRFMLAAKTSLKKLARERADMSQPQQ